LAKSLECELKWDTVAIIAYLEALSPDESSIIVATTHLVVWQATTEKEKIRSQQTLQVLETLENFKKEVEEEKISRGEDGGTTPIVLCGDFNSPPSSLVYQVVTRQSRKNEKLSLTFKSAYSYYPKLQEAQSESGSSSASEQMFGEPPYTTFVPQTPPLVVDYIFYSVGTMTPVKLLEIPQLPEGSGLPTATLSSDHVCIMCAFN
jgi:mRNA deadenylase 3'-5' endonuclease subunit Ccr4